MSTDLTFFTNTESHTLLQRFQHVLKHVQYFDVLVGYFRSSGFKLMCDSLNDVEQVRILVGLDVDTATVKHYQQFRQQKLELNTREKIEKAQTFFEQKIQEEYEQSEDSQDVIDGSLKFIEMLQSGKLEIKAHPSERIHAKVYIQRFPEHAPCKGSVITGSSNFSEAGLQGNYEFNVELKDARDVSYALEKFEELWAEGIDLKEVYLDTLKEKTWLKEVTPYELYLKCLYTYFEEEINDDASYDAFTPDWFMKLQYQQDAVIKISRILKEHNGAFISDVVGLGKTPMAAMVAQAVPMAKKLFLVPPPTMDSWKKTLDEFKVPDYTLESAGMLKKIVDKTERNGNPYDVIFIDEAHRFRNMDAQGFDLLKQLASNKNGERVQFVLITATPLNNSFYDFYPLIGLFQDVKQSTIPGVENLESFFDTRRLALKSIADTEGKKSPAYLDKVKAISTEVRESILRHIMVRRTRGDIKAFFKDDIEQQKLHFPTIEQPTRLVYAFDSPTDTALEASIQTIRDLTYARYTPLLYLKESAKGKITQQQNLKGFIRSLMIKRLESSKFAFENTLDRTIRSYERFIDMAKQGTVYISKKVNVFDYLDSDNEEKLHQLMEETNKVEAYETSAFRDDLFADLTGDLTLLKGLQTQWKSLQTDFKKEAFLKEMQTNPQLKMQQLIIFTESKETGEDLAKALATQSKEGEVIFYHSGCKAKELDLIRQAFDPSETPSETAKACRILITTDVLAEGVNLHRANCLVNYDLPWNPTRVLQRVGRVNRVGTKHESIHIFNFFPTAETDGHLGLEENILAKIQAFHNALGEDAKYLSETEELSAETLVSQLTKGIDAEAEEELDPELKYLNVIRDVRDKQPDLFARIKRLPKKARACKQHPTLTEGVLTFFRRGASKRFALAAQGKPACVLPTLEEAMAYLECEPNAKAPLKGIPPQFFSYLEANKQAFASPVQEEEPLPAPKGRGGKGNADFVLRTLKAIVKEPRFTTTDLEVLANLRYSLQQGRVGGPTIKTIKAAMETTKDHLALYQWIKTNVPATFLTPPFHRSGKQVQHQEVILSCYFAQP